jgi:hypothetical protein
MVNWGDLIDYLGDDPCTHSIVIKTRRSELTSKGLLRMTPCGSPIFRPTHNPAFLDDSPRLVIRESAGLGQERMLQA